MAERTGGAAAIRPVSHIEQRRCNFVRVGACGAQPVHLHGSLGREAATGRGTAFAIRELLKATGLGRVHDQKYVIQVRGGSGG